MTQNSRMSSAAKRSAPPGPAPAVTYFEQPLNERLRTFLRLEFLYRQLRNHLEQTSPWDSRAVLTGMLDIIAILSRGDVRSDVLKELERQLVLYDQLQHQPQVDDRRLKSVLRNLRTCREQLVRLGPQYLFALRENEFLNAVKHRSAIPGGTCEFDLPDFTHWLRQPYERRRADAEQWLEGLRALCEGVAELLWLMREAGQSSRPTAVNGVYQCNLNRRVSNNLLRVGLPVSAMAYPEISASHHRFTIRFMQWSGINSRPVQIRGNVEFDLQIC